MPVRLVKARFVEMFGDNNKPKYSKCSIGSLASITSGGTPDRKNDEYWKNGNITWIKTTELKNAEIFDSEEKITEKGLKNSAAKILPPDTVLIAMYGQGKTRGMTGFLQCESATNQACACLLPTDKINQRFLWQAIIQSYDELRNLAVGAGQPNLNMGMIANFQIINPPRLQQDEFVSFVSQVDKSKVAVQKALEQVKALLNSLIRE